MVLSLSGCTDGEDGVIVEDGADAQGNMDFSNFVPLTLSANAADWNPSEPWKLPEGYIQTVV